MQKKPALGRGLNALIPTPESKGSSLEGTLFCPVDRIRSNPDQPRKTFDEPSLASLAETIREKGVLQPLLVRKIGNHYEVIAGERRLRAAKIAGLEQVPVMIRESDEADSLELAVLENIQREDLNPIEEAKAYREMLKRFDITQEELAHRMGKDRSSIANTVRLLQLPMEIQEDLKTGELTAGHARALLGLSNQVLQLKIQTLIKEKGLSVREAEQIILRYKEGTKGRPAKPASLDPDLLRVQDELRKRFGAMVKILEGKKGGKIQIPFASAEDLDRIYSLLLEG